MAEHRHARLEAGVRLDVPSKRVADAAETEPAVAELIELAGVREPLERVALGHDDDREVLASAVAPIEQ